MWVVRGQNCYERKLFSILPQKPSRIRFSKNHVFSLNFRTKSQLTYFLGLTYLMARLGAKVSWSEVSFILKNTFSVGIFWWNRPHASFLGLIGYFVHSGTKLFRTKTLLNFASKPLSNSFFQKTRFRFEFFYKIAPHLFSWPNGLDGTIGGKSVPKRNFVHPKKHVFCWNFLMAPHLFSGPNWLFGAFGGKIVPDENFAQYCHKSPLKLVFPKKKFSVWIFL